MALSFILALIGCAHQPKLIFDETHPVFEWPPSPSPPRIRYVGQLRSTADLKRPRSLFDALEAFFVGEEQPEALYGPRAVLSLADEQVVWVADPGGRCLHRFDLRRRSYLRVRTVGSTDLVSPVGLCRGPNHSIFVCDAEAAAVYRLTDGDGVLVEEVSPVDALQRPVAVYYDDATGELFVVDAAAHDVKVMGPDLRLRRLIGTRGRSPGQFSFPLAIVPDGPSIWVLDTGNNRVQQFTKAGDVLAVFGRAGDAPDTFAMPKGLAIDGDGHLYIVDGRFDNVQIFDRKGRLLLFFGEEGYGPGEFWLPAGIHVDANNRVWICDAYNQRIQVFDYVGIASGGGKARGR